MESNGMGVIARNQSETDLDTKMRRSRARGRSAINTGSLGHLLVEVGNRASGSAEVSTLLSSRGLADEASRGILSMSSF